ncbi:MAG: mono/diheme cytochrome c family protein [Kiritimatiellia bacterium]|jgi:mono/diheme cytochrome c family protein
MRTALLMGALLLAGVALAKDSKRTHRPSDAVRGKELYDRHCQQCHGARGHGDGPATDQLIAEVPDLLGVVTHSNSSTFVPTVMDGKGPMPGFSASFDQYDARRVLRHLVRTTLQTTDVESVVPGATPEKSPTGPPPPSFNRNVQPKKLEQQ